MTIDDRRAGRRERLRGLRSPGALLVATSPVMAMLVLDQTAVSVALPSIAAELGADLADLQWVLSAFALGMIAGLPLGGSLGDRFGRRRMVLAGLAIFALSSIAASQADTVTLLIAVRVPQALGAAMMVPNAIALLSLAYPAARRGHAIATWTGLAFIGLVAGPLVGGAVTAAVGWSGVFWVAPPLALLCGTAVALLVDNDPPSPDARPFDIVGVVSCGLGLLLIAFTLIEFGRSGAQPQLAATALGGVLVLVWFVRHERRCAHPMIDIEVFGTPGMAITIVVATLVTSVMNGSFFFLSLYLQSVLGFDASRTGLVLVTFTVSVVIASFVMGRILTRIGVRASILAGLLTLSLAMAALAVVIYNQQFNLGFLVLLVAGGIGIGVLQSAETTGVMLLAPPGRSSVASAVLSTGRQLGSAFGVAMLGTISEIVIRTRTRQGLLPRLDETRTDVIASQAATGRTDPAGIVDAADVGFVVETVTRAQADGFGLVLMLAGLVLGCAWWLARRRLPARFDNEDARP